MITSKIWNYSVSEIVNLDMPKSFWLRALMLQDLIWVQIILMHRPRKKLTETATNKVYVITNVTLPNLVQV